MQNCELRIPDKKGEEAVLAFTYPTNTNIKLDMT